MYLYKYINCFYFTIKQVLNNYQSILFMLQKENIH